MESAAPTVAENSSAPGARARKPHRELPAEPPAIDNSASPERPATSRSGPRSVAEINREAAELVASNRDRDREKDQRRLAIQKQGNVFAVGDRELLLEKKNSETRLGGRLAEVRFSVSGATLYLEFSKTAAKDEPRGYIMKKDLSPDLNLESLRKFIGKNVQIRGQVSTPTALSRPEIELKNLAAIREVQ